MIARIRAWFTYREQVIARVAEQADRDRARVADLEEQLAKEQLHSGHLQSGLDQLTRETLAAKQRADIAEAVAARVRADAEFVSAARCECGGDTELYWRRRAAAAEQQAAQDRANAVRMADEIERLRLRADEADRLVHIAEQLERGPAVTA